MKIGVMGTGNIANVVTPTLKKIPELELYSVASRTRENALKFQAVHGFEKAYDSYEEFLNDPELEVVYVAVPHSHHYECMKMCIEHGKPAICEKAFTVNATQAREIQRLSAERGVYVTEALWTRYMPGRKLLDNVLESGIIGDIKALTANLAYNVCHRERLSQPELAGGALLDVGVYGINFTLMHFGGEIERIESAMQLLPSGVDGMESITIFFKNGRMANITAGITARSDRKGVFYGSRGYIVVENINNPQSITVYDENDVVLQHISVPEQISGYEYEFIESVRAIKEGRRESWSMPVSDSVRLMEVMDQVRRGWGLEYPEEIEKI